MTQQHKPQSSERYLQALERRRALSYAQPVGSRCACPSCTASWALHSGEPERVEAELRA